MQHGSCDAAMSGLGQSRRFGPLSMTSVFPGSRHLRGRSPYLQRCHKQTSPSRIHRYPSCLECVVSPHRRRPSPVIFCERDWNGEGPGPLCGPVLFRQPGRRCMLNGRTSSSVRELSPGRAEVPCFRIGSVDAVGRRPLPARPTVLLPVLFGMRSHGRGEPSMTG